MKHKQRQCNYHKRTKKRAKKKLIRLYICLVILLSLLYFTSRNININLAALTTIYLTLKTHRYLLFSCTIALSGVIAILYICFCKIKRNIGAGKKICKVDEMSGEAFERFLMYNFQKQGYRVKTTPVTGDYGADLILSKKGIKICVQAKRYKSHVGNSAVQEIVAAIAYYKCDKGMVVTNSYFTAAAKTLAKVNNVELWDRNKIINEFNIKR